MPDYSSAAPKHGGATTRSLLRVAKSKGILLGNFYAATHLKKAQLAVTLASKDPKGKRARAAGMDADDREALGLGPSPKSARGLVVCEPGGGVVFFALTDLAVQGARANQKQLKEALRATFKAYSEFALVRETFDVKVGTRKDFDLWYEETGPSEPPVISDTEAEVISSDLGMSKEEYLELIKTRDDAAAVLDDMKALDDFEEQRRAKIDEALLNLKARLEGSFEPRKVELYNERREPLFDRYTDDSDEDMWPARSKEDVEGWFRDADVYRERGDIDRALALLDRIDDYLSRGGVKETWSAVRGLESNVANVRSLVEKYKAEEDEPTSELLGYEHALPGLTNQVQAVMEAWSGGDWEEAARLAEAASLAVAKVQIPLLNYPFRSDQALFMSQGLDTTDDGKRLLEEIGSEGVCQALALDWLGGGGSKLDPGSRVEGKLDDSHIQGQLAYELEKKLGLRHWDAPRQAVEFMTGEDPTTAERAVNDLLDRIERMQKEIETAPQQLLEEKAELRGLEADLKEFTDDEIKLRTDTEYREMMGAKDCDDEAKEKREDIEKLRLRIEEKAEQIRETEELISDSGGQLQQLRDELARARDQKRVTDTTWQRIKGEYDRLHSAWDKASNAWRQARMSGQMLTSRVLGRFGLEIVPDSELVKRRAGGLTSEDLAAQLDDMMRATPPGEERRFDVGLTFEEGAGHAVAARLVAPAEDSGDPWDIELFDSNFGGFRFSDPSRARLWWSQTSARYDGEAISTITARAVRSVKPHDSSLTRPDPRTGWIADFGVVEGRMYNLKVHKPTSRKAYEDVELLRDRILRQLRGSPTRADYTIARRYLEDMAGAIVGVRWALTEYSKQAEQARVQLLDRWDSLAHADAVKAWHRAWQVLDTVGPEAGMDAMQRCLRELEKLTV